MFIYQDIYTQRYTNQFNWYKKKKKMQESHMHIYKHKCRYIEYLNPKLDSRQIQKKKSWTKHQVLNQCNCSNLFFYSILRILYVSSQRCQLCTAGDQDFTKPNTNRSNTNTSRHRASFINFCLSMAIDFPVSKI